ncbi:MAG: hypothetical protein K9N29_11145 [Candidatus Marinimicrobia bacterium]|nr:hypothetical protein [Candidatus Neomarinimicrobiota bacterium]
MDPIQKAVYQTIHQGKLSIPDLADSYGLTENSIYKMGLEDSQIVSAIKRVNSLMMLQGRDDILVAMNQRVGRLSIKIPRVPKNQQEESQAVADYQNLTNEAVTCLIQFFSDPSPENRTRLVDKLTEVTQFSMGLKKRVENGNQLDVFGGDK